LKTRFLLIVIFYYFSINLVAQSGFYLKNDIKKQRLTFKLINNIIVIPLEINGKKLSFILDSGVNKTILFNLSENDSIGLLNTSTVLLNGLGKGKPVKALLSKKNVFKIKNLISNQETIYVILKDYFDLSSKMGTTIHGIIGFNLLKNFIVRINYNTKIITFYNAKSYKYKKCRKCDTFPFKFYRKKPYIDAEAQLDTVTNKMIDVKLLVDTGGSDALWLFENSKKEIKTPKRFFNDILGEGLSGSIYGNRSRIRKFKLGKFEIENPTISFLDSVSTHNARKFKKRNGSIGAGILTRFQVWLDYPNKKITLKKNSFFKKPFNYNMTGLEVLYNGKEVVREKKVEKLSNSFNQDKDNGNTISFVTSFQFKFKPSYVIRKVVKNSPADKVGLKEKDKILTLNGRSAHNFTLADIIYKFKEKEGKKIRITVLRDGYELKFEFRLEKKI
jgi:hypothetical protein